MQDNPDAVSLKIFLSYASEQHDLAEQLYYTLRQSGHDVFFDRTSLPPGEDYNPTIINHIRQSDLFVFLVSPESVADGKYTRTEVQFAQQVWQQPQGQVLPVMAVATPMDQIPNYLKAVSILKPEGNLVAEVAAKINDRATGWTPEQTVKGQAELVDETRKHLEEVKWAQKLTEIDQHWQEQKRKHIRRGQSGKEVVPKIRHGVGFLIAAIAMAGILVFLQQTVFTDKFFDPFDFAPLVFVAVGMIGFFYVVGLASAYKKAERAYLSRRDEILRQMEAAGVSAKDD